MPWQPPRWRDFTPIGEQVVGTPFIPFKTPLREQWNEPVPEHQRLTPLLLMERRPEIGIVFDLTKTRYYPSSQLNYRGIEHRRIKLPTRTVPDHRLYEEFRDAVNWYLKLDNGKLVGVHSKHGVNRAGYMICRYMIEEMGIEPEQAIADFEEARGDGIEHQEFNEALLSLIPRVSPDRQQNN